MAPVDAPPQDLRGWRAWWLAARPRTLPVSVSPVLVGTALAFADGSAQAGPASAALLGALLLQIGANFANDLFDFQKGADTDARIGPPRAVALGLLTPRQMGVGTALAFGAALAVGSYLIAVAGWPLAVVGGLCILGGVAYTGGPWPLGYHGLGDVAVFVFFGLVAVCGSYYVQALEWTTLVWAAAIPVGCLATAILVVNNLRDIETDAAAGKRTLAVRLGRRATRVEYALLVLTPYAFPPFAHLLLGTPPLIYLPLLSLPLALRLLGQVRNHEDGPTLNQALASTAKLQLLYAVLLAAGIAG
ncbi:1,4-dihydroxy-2-naphthoate polyprenyltransferase [Myxococcota bacterium]|nr:1,4-dihydroxy-2-naphthoate polyprenyltransferase [Myxococcota bacterium]